MAKWQYRIAYAWETTEFTVGEPVSYAVREQREFEKLLKDGWEPVTGWGHPSGSAYRSHVMLRRKAKVKVSV